MEEEVKLNDIADELLILNKHTVEQLFQLEKCTDCIALYIFYYKTAKWQKTNVIKATDSYVQKCLGWGKEKTTNIKKILKKNGLIELVQRRNSTGKVDGWYIEVKYIVKETKTKGLQFKIKLDTDTEKPDTDFTTSRSQETNALNINNKCLKNKNNMLDDFEKIWKIYPKKEGKSKAFSYYKGFINGTKEYCGKKIKLTNKQMWLAVKEYADECEEQKRDMQYIKMGSTFFNSSIVEYVEKVERDGNI